MQREGRKPPQEEGQEREVAQEREPLVQVAYRYPSVPWAGTRSRGQAQVSPSPLPSSRTSGAVNIPVQGQETAP